MYFCIMKCPIHTISALILSLSLLLSCGERRGRTVYDALCAMDSLVEADADSALVVMGRTPSEDWSRRDAMRLELLRAKAMNRADSLFTTDSLMLRVAEYYRSHGTQNDRMLSLYLLGCTYRDMGAAPRAIETWQKAVAEADTTRQDCDLSTLMRIHSQMNVLYIRQRLPEYAQQEAEQAEAICWKMKDTLNAMLFQQDVCLNLYNNGKYKECIEHTLGLYNQYLNIGQKDKAALVCVYCIKSYLALGEYGKAKEYIDIYETCSYLKTNPRKINGGLAPYYIYKGRYYLGLGKIDSAEYCFRQAMPEMQMHMLHNDVAFYKGLQNVYNARHQADSVLKYSALYGQAKERSHASDIAQATVNAKNLYDYSVEQKIAQEKTEKLSQLKDIGYSVALIVFVILTTLITLFYKKRKQTQHLRTQLNNKEKRLEQAEQKYQGLHNQEKVLKREQKEALNQHKKEVKEYDSRLKANAKEKEKLLQTIQELKGQVDLLRTELGIKEMGRKAQTLENTEIVHQIKDFLNHPIGHIQKSQWKRLAETVNETHPDFYNRMNRYQSLNEEEYRVCLLTLIGCTSGDINTLLEKSTGYASNCKKRLHHIVFKEPGTAQDFTYKIRTFV